MTRALRMDRALAEASRALPSGAVITDPDVLAAYAGDESEAPPCRPDALVRVTRREEVAAVLRVASRLDIPVTPRGAGTNRVGGAVPVAGGIVLAFERMNQINEIERSDRLAVVEPGLITGDLHGAVEAEGLFYPPDPSSWSGCQIGGNIATNAGGPRALKYGVTRDYVLGLEVVTAEGEILDVGRRTRKGVTGYDVTSLLVGSEGTLAVITAATLRLLPRPDEVATIVASLPSETAIVDLLDRLQARGVVPRCAELLDGFTLAILHDTAGIDVPLGTRALLIVELDGPAGSLERDLESSSMAMEEAGAIDMVAAIEPRDRERLWRARREMSRAIRSKAGAKLSEDVVVPPSKVPHLLALIRSLEDRFGVRMPTYGHAGDGNLHVNFLYDDESEQARVDRAIESLFRGVVAMGGSLSGEHGIGILKAPFLPLEQSNELILLQKRLKSAFDPKHILNPGKILTVHGHGVC